jgi:hypothetical protein
MALTAHNPTRPPEAERAQSTDTVVMVRPACFASNDQTRGTNAFQASAIAETDVASTAIAEFDRAVATLRDAGVTVIVVDDEPAPAKPDAVFPNNWFSTHADGSVVLYPMHAPNRRDERRFDLLQRLGNAGFRCSHLIDLSPHELAGRCLEGTGSLVLDRIGGVAYACRSPRTDTTVLGHWAREMDARVVAFDAVDAAGRAIYHTNVVMCVGTGWAVVCLDALPTPAERAAVANELTASGREVIPLALAQMTEFAGNMLELRGVEGERLIAMSARARRALGSVLEARLARHGRILTCDIPTIETVGGGSLRCMIAEIFLPRGAHHDG